MSHNTHPPTIFLMGPTASGKTALAFALAKSLPVEIISVDSAMVYRGLDIGTGKPTKEELAATPHHLIDIRSPSDPYSASEFEQDALTLIDDIHSRGKIPLLVGGTMLYFRALEQGLSDMPSANPAIREKILNEANRLGELGWQTLHHRLSLIDPASANRIHPNDTQRIQRALEVYECTGKPMSSFFSPFNSGINPNDSNHSSGRTGRMGNILAFALMTDTREELYHRIEERFKKMLELGFVEEVKTLFESNFKSDLGVSLDLNTPAIRSVGYRQCWQYLSGEFGLDEMVEKAITATRHLAKRQLTWLRNLNNNLCWLSANDHSASEKIVIHSVTQ